MNKKIFSVPLNPKLDSNQFYVFTEWLKRNKEWISDVYFTSRIAPFKQDAMGEVIIIEEDQQAAIENAFIIQDHIGIPISATFNNIEVPPTQKNLDIFIFNFKKLYDAGVKIATIPHTHWMATGQIKAAFPDLFVKNTILRDVRTAVEVVNLAKVGFDYINLDRDLMRDRDTLLRLKEAKVWIKENLGKDIQYSLLANEGCLGACPMMVEHFQYNNTRDSEQPQYFNDPISRVSCPKWEVQDPAITLKTANLPGWREDWEEFFDLGIDVFKMHGRENYDRLAETMQIVDRWAAGEEYIHDNFENFLKETNLVGKPISIWREKIKNCKFDCWECQYCDRIAEAKVDIDYSDLVKHVASCIADSGVPKINNKIPGLTSIRVQTLLNSIASGVGSYLEIGSFLGATAAAVLQNNPLNAYFVDNWKQQIQPSDDALPELPSNNKDDFVKNITPYILTSKVVLFDSDLFQVDLKDITDNIQMMFYDGPHDFDSVTKAIQYYYPVLSKESVIILDDANWEGVVDGANYALAEMGAHITYRKIILNSEENKTEWWNGLYILIVEKL
jgi:predicted O-methyltransferase YrrM